MTAGNDGGSDGGVVNRSPVGGSLMYFLALTMQMISLRAGPGSRKRAGPGGAGVARGRPRLAGSETETVRNHGFLPFVVPVSRLDLFRDSGGAVVVLGRVFVPEPFVVSTLRSSGAKSSW